MTTFFGGPGFGGAATQPPSREAQALKGIDSRSKPFVNKDFVKNIQWLNQSVDTLSVYTQKLQQGVDAANQNALEQIQGFIADLIVIFGGGMPTGINLGDLQYVFQAIGALLGINPDTVFPLNLVEAVGNLFQQFIVPLPQFADVIFDSLYAWAEEFGFSDEAVEAVREFNEAIIELYLALNGFTSNIIPALNNFLKKLGFGLGWIDLGLLKQLVADLVSKINQILEGPKQFLLNALSLLIVTLFKALTWLVRLINPNNLLASMGLQVLGPDVAPPISHETVVWQVGSNDNTQWVYDGAVMYGDSGSFRTKGNAYGKRILTQGTERCIPGQTFALSGWLLWDSVPLGQNAFGPTIVFYAGLNEVSNVVIDAPSDRALSGGWEQVGQKIIVPNDVDGFKIGYRCATSISQGTIWAGPLTCTTVDIKLDISTIFNWVPWDIFSGIPTLGDLSINGVREWLKELLTPLSPLNAFNLFNLIPPNLLAQIPIGSLMSVQPNMLANPGYDVFASIQGQEDWVWDASIGRTKFGSARYDCKAKNVELYNVNVLPTEEGQKWTFETWVRWRDLAGGNHAPILFGINVFSDAEALHENEIGRVDFDAFGSFGPSSDWVMMRGNYTVPQGVRSIKVRKQVTERALGGSVWFDDAVGRRTSLLQWSLIDNLQNAWNSLLSVLGGVQVWIGDQWQNLAEAFDNIVTRLRNLLPTGLFDASWLTNILNIPQLSDISIPGILTIVDNVVGTLFRWEGFGFSHTQSAEALASLREMTLANSVQLQQFIASIQIAGVNDTFGRSLVNLGSNWAVSGDTGHMWWATNGTAYWYAQYPYGTGQATAIWVGSEFPTTATVYQRVGIVVAGAPGYNISGNTGHNDVLFRCGAGSYGRFRVSGDRTWQLVYFRNGNPIVVGSGWLPYHYGAGHFIYVDAGDLVAEDPWMVRCYVGSDLICQWHETQHTILFADDQHKQFGMGGRAEGLLYAFNNQKPGPVAQFVATDQQPPPTTG